MLSSFFYQRTKKELFVRGRDFDQEIIWKFGWLLWLEPIIGWFLPQIDVILLFDQVTRHYYREFPEDYRRTSQRLTTILTDLTFDQLEKMSLMELAFTSLATRHLLKIYSQANNPEASALSSCGCIRCILCTNHQNISRQLDNMIKLTENRLKFRFQIGDTIISGSDGHLNLDLVRAIHSKNKQDYRSYRYVSEKISVWDKSPWEVVYGPENLTNSIALRSEIDWSEWSIGFLKTPIAQYVIRILEKQIESNIEFGAGSICHRFYVMCSGGIDSMTLVRIFNGLRLSGYFEKKQIKVNFGAIHINWRKRNESTREALELANFLEAIGMPYRIIKSPIDPESPQWDRLSTEYRFRILGQIQTLDNLFEKQLGPDSEDPLQELEISGPSNGNELVEALTNRKDLVGELTCQTYFCLGHIADDLIENLICNVCLEGSATGKQTYFDLFGMNELTEYRGVQLLRPLLLHTKPNARDTPCLKDNATNLDIKRRIVRRAIGDLGYNLSRVSKLYTQSTEMRQKYRQHPIEILERTHNNSLRFKYQRSWSLAEWEEIMIGATDRQHWPALKKAIIKEIFTTIQNRSADFWESTGRGLNRSVFRITIFSDTITLDYLKI